jgi:hypothetical protein
MTMSGIYEYILVDERKVSIILCVCMHTRMCVPVDGKKVTEVFTKKKKERERENKVSY